MNSVIGRSDSSLLKGDVGCVLEGIEWTNELKFPQNIWSLVEPKYVTVGNLYEA